MTICPYGHISYAHRSIEYSGGMVPPLLSSEPRYCATHYTYGKYMHICPDARPYAMPIYRWVDI